MEGQQENIQEIFEHLESVENMHRRNNTRLKNLKEKEGENVKD